MEIRLYNTWDDNYTIISIEDLNSRIDYECNTDYKVIGVSENCLEIMRIELE